MSATIGKLVPTAAVATVAIWCCWPYFGETVSRVGMQQADSLPQIAQSLLSSVIEPTSDRNPFKPWEALNTDSTPNEQPTAANTAQNAQSPEEDAFDILNSLMLDATFIQGSRRMALINGRVCEQGEPLAISGSIAEPCIVSRISAHSVLIQYGDRTVELTYRSAVASANPSKLQRATP